MQIYDTMFSLIPCQRDKSAFEALCKQQSCYCYGDNHPQIILRDKMIAPAAHSTHCVLFVDIIPYLIGFYNESPVFRKENRQERIF
ncbi:MAG: hypothetical protein DBY45_04445 [Clostridiales bacterium]|nr:MAG: hypothetical protein DBY45_04445 [Clostridiales bacterium]